MLEAVGRDESATVGPVTMVDRGPVTRTVEVDTSDGLLALRENFNPGWDASTDGRSLDPVVVDGWRQGWRLRQDTQPDIVTVRFAPDDVYRVALLAGLVLLVALIAGCLWPRRAYRRELVELQERAIGLVPSVLVGLAAGGLLAGWPGFAISAITVGGVMVARRAHELTGTVVASLVLGASLFYVLSPWGSSTGWAGREVIPQYLVLIAVIAVLVRPAPATVPADEEVGPTSPDAPLTGASTQRPPGSPQA